MLCDAYSTLIWTLCYGYFYSFFCSAHFSFKTYFITCFMFDMVYNVLNYTFWLGSKNNVCCCFGIDVSFSVFLRELEDTLDVLQGDIDVLEREKLELKERLKVLSKKTLLEGLTRQSSGMSGCCLFFVVTLAQTGLSYRGVGGGGRGN